MHGSDNSDFQHREVPGEAEFAIGKWNDNRCGHAGIMRAVHSKPHTSAALPRQTMAEIEVEAMQKTLEIYDGNITHAVQALGMAKSTFYRKRA